MRVIGSFGQALTAALKSFLSREVWPAEKADHCPPIRYLGDPTEIYLA